MTISFLSMHSSPFQIHHISGSNIFDFVLDKKIQQVVDELTALPHDILIRNLTYWADAIDSHKYPVESDLPYEEWYNGCCTYAASQSDEERYMCTKSLSVTLGYMLQDVKLHHPNKYPAAMRTISLWKKYQFIGFYSPIKAEIDQIWIEPSNWNDGKPAALAFVPILKTLMRQYEEGRMPDVAGNAFYLLERLARLYSKDSSYFDPDNKSHCSYYEFLLEAVCHILTLVMKDKRTGKSFRNAMVWHINTINLLYGQIFESSFTCFEDFMYGNVTATTFTTGYDFLVLGLEAFTD